MDQPPVVSRGLSWPTVSCRGLLCPAVASQGISQGLPRQAVASHGRSCSHAWPSVAFGIIVALRVYFSFAACVSLDPSVIVIHQLCLILFGVTRGHHCCYKIYTYICIHVYIYIYILARDAAHNAQHPLRSNSNLYVYSE